jgi:lipopolysaccharide transport system ATP-binding protein
MNGEVSNTIDITESVAIEMEYDVLEGGRVLLPHFHLFNDEGAHVFVSIDQDPQWRNERPRPAGRYKSTAWIPGNLLSEGTMYVTPALTSLMPRAEQFYVRDIIAFQVIDSMTGNSARGEYANKLGGVVRPLLKWTTELVPAFTDVNNTRDIQA